MHCSKSYIAFMCSKLYAFCPFAPGKYESGSFGFAAICKSEPSTASSRRPRYLESSSTFSVKCWNKHSNASGRIFALRCMKAEDVPMEGSNPKKSIISRFSVPLRKARMEEITLWKGNFLFLVLSFPGRAEKSHLQSSMAWIVSLRACFTASGFIKYPPCSFVCWFTLLTTKAILLTAVSKMAAWNDAFVKPYFE